MNERDKELWTQAEGHYNSGNQYAWPEYTITDPEKFADLIRADAMEAAKIALLGADKALSDRVVKAIRARGNT